MALKRETIPIAKALLALHTAVLEINNALHMVLKDPTFLQRLEAVERSSHEALEEIKKLIDLLDRSDG